MDTRDTEELKALIAFMQSSQHDLNIQEVEIKKEDGRAYRVALQPTGAVTTTFPAHTPHGTTEAPADLAKPAEPEGFQIKSPMVGTAYLTPSPEADPFVQVGQTITQGQTVCLIEAMKMFNKIQAETSGIVKKILIKNGQPVEFGQPLVILED